MDIFTATTRPPSPSRSSSDGDDSEHSAPGGGENMSYSPGRLFLQEVARVSEERLDPHVLELSAVLDEEKSPMSTGLPGQLSVGSMYHHMGCCRPCDFVHRSGGCRSGAACKFCHLCGPDQRKHVKKIRTKLMKDMQKAGGPMLGSRLQQPQLFA